MCKEQLQHCAQQLVQWFRITSKYDQGLIRVLIIMAYQPTQQQSRYRQPTGINSALKSGPVWFDIFQSVRTGLDCKKTEKPVFFSQDWS